MDVRDLVVTSYPPVEGFSELNCTYVLVFYINFIVFSMKTHTTRMYVKTFRDSRGPVVFITWT